MRYVDLKEDNNKLTTLVVINELMPSIKALLEKHSPYFSPEMFDKYKKKIAVTLKTIIKFGPNEIIFKLDNLPDELYRTCNYMFNMDAYIEGINEAHSKYLKPGAKNIKFLNVDQFWDNLQYLGLKPGIDVNGFIYTTLYGIKSNLLETIRNELKPAIEMLATKLNATISIDDWDNLKMVGNSQTIGRHKTEKEEFEDALRSGKLEAYRAKYKLSKSAFGNKLLTMYHSAGPVTKKLISNWFDKALS